MKYAILLSLVVLFIGCDNSVKPNARELKKSDSLAKVYIKQIIERQKLYDSLDRVSTMRYFLISYEIGSNHVVKSRGHVDFPCTGFPALSDIRDVLKVKKKQHLVIRSVYEFKDSVDFNNFRK
jgi:hypothetical protein